MGGMSVWVVPVCGHCQSVCGVGLPGLLPS